MCVWESYFSAVQLKGCAERECRKPLAEFSEQSTRAEWKLSSQKKKKKIKRKKKITFQIESGKLMSVWHHLTSYKKITAPLIQETDPQDFCCAVDEGGPALCCWRLALPVLGRVHRLLCDLAELGLTMAGLGMKQHGVCCCLGEAPLPRWFNSSLN